MGADRGFATALRWAFWRSLRGKLGHQCNDLVPTEQVLKPAELRRWRKLGEQSVPVERILGSSGRAHEFDLHFLPRYGYLKARWTHVTEAEAANSSGFPVLLIKIQDVYFVEDGNHRVSVARARNESVIHAQVVELDIANLKPKSSCTRLRFKVE